MKKKLPLILLTCITLAIPSCARVEKSSSEQSESSVSSVSSKASSSSGDKSSSASSQSSVSSSSQIASLESNPATCDNHELNEGIIKKATIIEKGIKRFKCSNCGGFQDEWYYDFDELVFEDKTFMYDGKERTLYVDGMVPYGLTVQYENNKQTAIGSHEAKAKFVDSNNKVIKELTATISVVENIGIPEIRVTTSTGEDPDYKEKEQYTSMTASLSNCDPQYAFSNKGGGIRVRGNSTNQDSVNKRAWRLKFERAVNMLGLNGGPDGKGFKSWVLLADNFEYSYFRNATAFNFGDTLFNHSGNYASHFQHVNFYMNDDYRGVYLLAEQQQANLGRIGLAEADNYTGTDVGYLVEIDGLVSTGQSKEEYTFTTGSSSSGGNQGGFPWGGGWGMGSEQINGVTISDKGYVIKTDVFGDEQAPFIEKYINNVLTLFKNAVKGEKLQVLDENNELVDSPYSTQYETLNSVMDIESIFKMYVLQEFMKNYDCGWGSFYLFVDFSKYGAHKRLTCGAPWDFDLSSGNKQNQGKYKPDGDFITQTGGSMTEFNPWLYLLSQTDFFDDMFYKYYTVFVNSNAYDKAIQYINYEASAFKTDFDNEYAKWAGNSGRNSMQTRSYSTHAEAVEYLLNWYASRKAYLDGKYLNK